MTELTSDDEVQTQLKEVAGIPSCKQGKREREYSEFEKDMENELDLSISDYASKHMGQPIGKVEEMETDDGPPPLESASEDDELEQAFKEKKEIKLDSAPVKSALKAPSTSEISKKSPSKRKQVSIKEEEVEKNMQSDQMETDKDVEENPIKKMAKNVEKQMKEDPPEFYDADEDDDNERWIADQRRQNKGDTSTTDQKLNEKQLRAKIDDGSDAVLSCPGCMSLLTRDCQRHEIYKDQYRAMFVENVHVEDEPMAVEKSSREKRRQKHKQKKSKSENIASAPDIFYPVKCAVCATSVAVMDLDEVYHFFNVLAGYA